MLQPVAHRAPTLTIARMVQDGIELGLGMARAPEAVTELAAVGPPPYQAFVPIEGAGHFAVFMTSDRFWQELVQRVRPLAIDH